MHDSPHLTLTKAHAYGNDFLLADEAPATAAARAPHDPGLGPHAPHLGLHASSVADLARRVCDRHRGIGADGLMLIAEREDGTATRLFNADGGEAEISGNGLRCAAAWLAHRRGLAAGASILLGTVAGDRRLELLETADHRFRFRADMGAPEEVRQERLDVDGSAVDVVVLRVGNPQCVVIGPATPERLHTLASRLAVHPRFPQGTNVELAEVEAPDRVRILIWERGVGPTEASGTGACAAAVAAAFASGAGRRVEVLAPGGAQLVEWTSQTLWLSGWAEIVGTVEWWGT
jgi:diaminopimelate epimerase